MCGAIPLRSLYTYSFLVAEGERYLVLLLFFTVRFTGWTVRRSNPGGARFFARPDRSWGPPSLLYNGYRVLHGVKYGRGVLLTTHPLLVAPSWKSRATPLPTLWATTGPVTGTHYFLQVLNVDHGRLGSVFLCLGLSFYKNHSFDF